MVDRIEVLLDVLGVNGFPDIRSKMREREEELVRSSTFREILTAEEVEVVKGVLKEFKVPAPTGWANALVVHAMREEIARFSSDKGYDYSELCNLSYTLREAGLADSGIWGKIEEAKKTMKRYDS